MIKLKIFIMTILSILLLALPAHADVVWPSLYISVGMLSIWVILIGLIIEILFVKFFTDIKWLKVILATIFMNAVTCMLGIVLIPIEGLFAELVLIGSKTFHWSHWALSYFLVILVNTLIEGLILKLILKLKFKKIFGWLFTANFISVMICMIYIYFNRPKL